MVEHNRSENCIKFLPKEEGCDYVILNLPNHIQGGQAALNEKLSDAYKNVKEGGRLVVFMDNPYALHMFAGDTDKEGSFFASLDKKSEDECNISADMLKLAAAGMGDLTWFYPYPTLEFPVAVYSDAYLPKTGECVENNYNFDFARLSLFNETDAFDEVIKSGQFREFANCYMLVIGRPFEQGIKYCRYSNERAKGLRIRTNILESSVQKAAFDAASIPHIQSMVRWEEKLNKQFASLEFMGKAVQANHITKVDSDSVSFEFIGGRSLSELLDELLIKGEVQQAKQILTEFCSIAAGGTKCNGAQQTQTALQTFEQTEAFTKVFGSLDKEKLNKIMTGASPFVAAEVTDIDMICQNVLIGDRVHVIDYEWTFDFPVPTAYVVYRILFFFLEFKNRSSYFTGEDLYEELGITKDMKEMFAQMETSFQKYVQGDTKLISDSYFEKGKPALPMELLQKELKELEQSDIRIVLKTEAGVREETRACKKDAEGIVSFTVDFTPGTVKSMQLLPGTEKAMMRICLLQEDETGSKEIAFTANGLGFNPILYLFHERAEISITDFLPETHRLYVSLQAVALPETFAVESERSISDLKENLANRELQIENLKNSASWRITKPLRRLKGNKDDE